MLRKLISFCRRVIGTTQILNHLFMLDKEKISSNHVSPIDSPEKLEMLPGSSYSKVAMPLDYPPSREYRPRWGYSTEKIKVLNDWFDSYEDRFASFITRMFNQNISSIAGYYDPKKPLTPAFMGGAICAFDSLAIYVMLAETKPEVYCEIGSGMTTLYAKQAIVDNRLGTKIISIDPEPRQFVDDVCDEIVREPLESINPEWFDQLNPSDILFVDGSHRSFMNSDVTVFFIDILPRLKPGVIIHIHDITLPYDYPDSFKDWYWNEQYLLAVYLMSAKEKVTPLLPTAYICRNEKLKTLISESYFSLGDSERNESWFGGGSFWFTKN